MKRLLWIICLLGLSSCSDGSEPNIAASDEPKLPLKTTAVSSKSYADELRQWMKNNQGKLSTATTATTTGNSFKDCPECPEMVNIPAGNFMMGSEKGSSDEKPVHRVDIAAFAIGKYEVTFDEYDAFTKATGRDLPENSSWGRGKRPVINISWLGATAYTEWLSQKTGKTYRLPTEAEWEYAARGGTATEYWWGNEVGQNNANCSGCGSQWDNKQTVPVGSFKSNRFGLHDVAGNVWEWTCSEYTDSYNGKEQECISKNRAEGQRVVRGGSWGDEPNRVRSAFRNRSNPSTRGNYIGLRVVLLSR